MSIGVPLTRDGLRGTVTLFMGHCLLVPLGLFLKVHLPIRMPVVSGKW